MDRQKIEDQIEFIQFFQSEEYLERAAQIKEYKGYDNYLDYFVSKKLDPIRYLKIKMKQLIKKEVASSKQTEDLLRQIETKDYVCIVAPFYKDKKMDGYYKRIEQADEDTLKDLKKIYLDHTELGNRRFAIERYDESHVVVHYNSFNEDHLSSIRKIVGTIGKLYIHSVHILMPDVADHRLFKILFNKQNKTVLDLHGAVSEELKQFDTLNRAKMAEFIEEIAMASADRIVCMSEAMSAYYQKLYGIEAEKMIVMSILPYKDPDISLKEKIPHDVPGIIYAGGIQKWQNIDLIKESVRTNIGKYRFKIFTHENEKLKEDWNDMQNDLLCIGNRSNEEIYKEYEDCDYGFLLRDDNVVNNVACPTKMMEYLRFGIIPILKTDRIGNFKEYGLQYISLKDFNEGKVPDEEERKRMINNNYEILLKIIDQSKNGTDQIREYLK